MRTVLFGLTLAALELAGYAGAQKHPLAKDRTGIRWVLPFQAARAEAAAANRLLLIKPVAFGTTPDGGW